MFSIGLPEIALIFLVLILFIKPEDIPKVFQTLGKWHANLRRIYIGVTDEFREISYQLDLTNNTVMPQTEKEPEKEGSNQTIQAPDDEDKSVSFQGPINKR